MDTNGFSEQKTGRLVSVDITGGTDTAFIPEKLPPASWEFPTRLWPLLADAREALGTLDGIGRTLPDPQLLLHPLRTREAITSSRLEGTYATAQQVMLFELNPREPKSSGDEANAWREVSNYGKALAKGAELLQEMPFCLRLIRILHEELMSGVRGHHRDPGQFRKHQVAIGSDRRYIPPPPGSPMDECLAELETYINLTATDYDPLVRAYAVHYQVEAIHPFGDGNGRIGRVLLSLMIYSWCKHQLPWLYMSAYFEKHKDEYINNLFRISTEGAWEPWIEFCLRGTIAQAHDSIRRCDQLGRLRDRMLKQASQKSPRTEQIVRDLFSSPLVQVAALSRKLDVSYPTASADLKRLVEVGVLRVLEGVHPKTYFAPEIFSIAYEPYLEL